MKIYDCFTFFNELELLKIRLHEMSPVVDRFVLVEATQTFQGRAKPLVFQENRHLFEDFEDKIVHVVVDFPERIVNRINKKHDANWGREYFQRDQIARGLVDAGKDDLIIVSDVDEIISTGKLREALETRRRHELTIFEMPIHPHYVDRRNHRETWVLGPRMIEFSRFPGAQKLRMCKLYASKKMRGSLLNRIHTRLWNAVHCGVGSRICRIENAGWHLTSIGGWESWRLKVDSFSHAEYRHDPIYASQEAFTRHVRETTSRVDLDELPAYVRENVDKFAIFGS